MIEIKFDNLVIRLFEDNIECRVRVFDLEIDKFDVDFVIDEDEVRVEIVGKRIVLDR